MHSSLILRYAAASTAPSRPSKAVSDLSKALLPPLPLYRRLLRVHRMLPLEMRSMGDAYVRSEFRLHKSIDNPIHIVGFLQQWKGYLEVLETQAAREGLTNGIRGKKMELGEYEKLSEEQIGQLYELMHATQEIWKSPEEIAAEEEAQPAADILGGSNRKE